VPNAKASAFRQHLLQSRNKSHPIRATPHQSVLA